MTGRRVVTDEDIHTLRCALLQRFPGFNGTVTVDHTTFARLWFFETTLLKKVRGEKEHMVLLLEPATAIYMSSMLPEIAKHRAQRVPVDSYIVLEFGAGKGLTIRSEDLTSGD